jgi:hypothetical protein
MSGLNFNSNVDQPGMPNQSSPGANYSPADAASIVLSRKGVVTRAALPAALGASRIVTFQPVANPLGGWLAGDIVFIHIPVHTGGGFTVTIENIAAGTLATWAALLQNGGMFVFDGVLNDFVAVIPGVTT